MIKYGTVSMLNFKLHLYKLGVYSKAEQLVYDSDFLIILAWRYQHYINEHSLIYVFLKDAIPNLKLETIMQDPADKTIISSVQFRVMLYQYGVYEDIDNYMNSLNDYVRIIWNHSPIFSLNSDIIKLVTEKAKWPDGKSFTDQDMQELFETAATLQL